MKKFKRIMRIGLLYVCAVLVAGGYPLSAMAETAPVDTSTTAPAEQPPAPTYTYNPQTNHWDSDKWQYDPVSGQYIKVPAPVISAPVTTDPTAPENLAEPPVAADSSAGSVDTQDPTSAEKTNTTSEVKNDVTSVAQSGNAGVTNNTSADDAASGDATAATTIVNTVHSSVGGDTAGIAHFVSDIHGNVSGDITLYPALQNALSASSVQPTESNVQVNNSSHLTNNVSLGATSGNADVLHNTSAGSATSGDAHTVANVINLINSIIAANKSFVGTINIYGNLDGDILISPDFIPQLLASNSPDPTTGPLSVNLSDTQSIVNTVSLGATAGSAEVIHNTGAGSATSGSAATNLTILNLSGHQVVASNSLLVFVNVLGKWVGMIVDAPAGATAAALGNGVTNNTTGGQTVAATNNSQITNNIDLTSQSGNATVAGNTAAGNATSGNATASANILNVSTSTFSVSDWFGILFINVFGSWQGSFGINTASGDVVPLDGMALPPANFPAASAPLVQLGFTPRASAKQSSVPVAAAITNDSEPTESSAVPAVLAAATVSTPTEHVTMAPPQKTAANPVFAMMMAVGFLGAAATLITGVVRRRLAARLA